MMKIAIISDRSYPYFKGGAEKRYWEIAKRLTAFGHQVHFYTGQWPGMPQQTVCENITLHGVYKVKQFYVDGHKSIKESLLYTVSLLPHLLRDEYDLVECDQFPLLPIFVSKLVSLLRNKPLMVTWHEVWNKDLWVNYLGQRGRLGAVIESHASRLPDHIISVSCHTTQKLIQQYGLSDRDISTVPNGIDLESICRNKPVDKGPDVIFVGRLLDHKHVDVLLQVVRYVKGFYEDITCFIIGDGPERARLEELSSQLGLEHNIRFLGYVKDDRRVYSLIASSRVFVLPSTREGFGIVVLEANACGIPVLVVEHKDNAASELIQEGVNGFICNLDPVEIGTRVLQILKDAPSNYRSACHKKAQNYSWERIVSHIETIYLQHYHPIQKHPLHIPT